MLGWKKVVPCTMGSSASADVNKGCMLLMNPASTMIIQMLGPICLNLTKQQLVGTHTQHTHKPFFLC